MCPLDHNLRSFEHPVYHILRPFVNRSSPESTIAQLRPQRSNFALPQNENGAFDLGIDVREIQRHYCDGLFE